MGPCAWDGYSVPICYVHLKLEWVVKQRCEQGNVRLNQGRISN